jgi:hypothetical protein
VDVGNHVSFISDLIGSELSALDPGRFALVERVLGTHWIEGWLGSSTGIDKSQDKNPRSQQSVNMLYCVLSMVTKCFGLRKRPYSGDYRIIQNIKKKVTIRRNGSVESNSTILSCDLITRATGCTSLL